jgi:hypothetical protein
MGIDEDAAAMTCWRSRSTSTIPVTRRMRACSAWCWSGDAGGSDHAPALMSHAEPAPVGPGGRMPSFFMRL